MKKLFALLICLLLFVSTAYSLINFKLYPEYAQTGGWGSHTQDGTYTSHTIIGDYNGADIHCDDSDDVCFTAVQDGLAIDVSIFNLTNPPPPTEPISVFRVSADSVTGNMTVTDVTN